MGIHRGLSPAVPHTHPSHILATLAATALALCKAYSSPAAAQHYTEQLWIHVFVE
ncbi:hypothetical protein I79_005164 [Cricetulus griseus]|uniref:Uncharacterized protein n=1 Tax=Cricetulus griseus TaxID=10029 RepID=G3H4G3_CRIGR|nr:hypothetical protein I79_005164 [Cricetulus griseus]